MESQLGAYYIPFQTVYSFHLLLIFSLNVKKQTQQNKKSLSDKYEILGSTKPHLHNLFQCLLCQPLCRKFNETYKITMRINSEFSSVAGYNTNMNNELHFYNKLDIEIKK